MLLSVFLDHCLSQDLICFLRLMGQQYKISAFYSLVLYALIYYFPFVWLNRKIYDIGKGTWHKYRNAVQSEAQRKQLLRQFS